MIIDTHDHLARYGALFRDVDPEGLFSWLKMCRDIPSGQKVEFCGEKLFVKTLRHDTAERGALRWESHREYVDLHYIVGGSEVVEWAPVAKLVPDGSYDAGEDVQFYGEAAADMAPLMVDGLFAFLFPEDGHKPLVANGKDRFVQKAVAKIHRSLLLI